MTTRHPAGHLWGSQSYRSGDHSGDKLVLGTRALGEGWHNSHHTFLTSARHGLQWWQVDVSYYVISTEAAVGHSPEFKPQAIEVLSRVAAEGEPKASSAAVLQRIKGSP